MAQPPCSRRIEVASSRPADHPEGVDLASVRHRNDDDPVLGHPAAEWSLAESIEMVKDGTPRRIVVLVVEDDQSVGELITTAISA